MLFSKEIEIFYIFRTSKNISWLLFFILIGIFQSCYASDDIFTVQGITTGMTQKPIESHLKANSWAPGKTQHGRGWTKKDNTKFKRLFISYSKVGNDIVAHSIKYAINFTTPNYNPNTVLEQLKSRYGKPHVQSGKTMMYWELADAPSRNDMSKACREEALRSGMPAYQAAAKVQQVVNLNSWATAGDTLLKDICPSVLPMYNQYIAREFGKYLEVGLIPRRGGYHYQGDVNINLTERGLQQKGIAQIISQNKKARNAAPKASLGTSDF